MVHDPASCVPPAWTEQRREWCGGFVKGSGCAASRRETILVATTIVIHMDVLGGGFPFEEFNRGEDGRYSQDQWRQTVEQHLPEMVVELCFEMAQQGMRESQQSHAARFPYRGAAWRRGGRQRASRGGSRPPSRCTATARAGPFAPARAQGGATRRR
jgi:hypothetical protein